MAAVACAASAWGQSAALRSRKRIAPARTIPPMPGRASDFATGCRAIRFAPCLESDPAQPRARRPGSLDGAAISVGAFAGGMFGGPLIGDWTGSTAGFDGGWRVGWDVDPSWGTEMRFAFASLGMYDSNRAEQALIALDNSNGLSP